MSMPFTIKSRKTIETPLEAEYKKHIAWHTRDNDPSAPKPSPKPIRSFALVDDTVTISPESSDASSEQAKVQSETALETVPQETKNSEPVTPAEKSHLGIFSIRV